MYKIASGPYQVNTWIVPLSDNDVLVIDPAACASSGDKDKITSFLASYKLNPIAILLTHGHFDHITGLKTLKASYPVLPIMIHKADSKMAGFDAVLFQAQILYSLGLEELVQEIDSNPPADILLGGGETLYEVMSTVPGVKLSTMNVLKNWQIIHTPGHTPGSVCYYNKKDGILISGDTLFYHSYGRTDLQGGDEAQILNSLVMLRERIPPQTLVYPGHESYGFKIGENFKFLQFAF